ncbi:MAG: methylated-DNA--[protein]-cysteine S-methyltransferase [Chitinophagaceae bacterium]
MDNYYKSAIGILKINASQGKLIEVKFVDQSKKYELNLPDVFIKIVLKQIQEYAKGQRKLFDIPLAKPSTDFQKNVTEAVLKIPNGKTTNYSEIAANIGKPKAMRAVGMAHTKNPFQIILPFHRIVKREKSTGKIIFNDSIQEILLKIENVK